MGQANNIRPEETAQKSSQIFEYVKNLEMGHSRANADPQTHKGNCVLGILSGQENYHDDSGFTYMHPEHQSTVQPNVSVRK